MASPLALSGPVKGRHRGEEFTKYYVTVSPNIPALCALLQLAQSSGKKGRVLILTWFCTLLGVNLPKSPNQSSNQPNDPQKVRAQRTLEDHLASLCKSLHKQTLESEVTCSEPLQSLAGHQSPQLPLYDAFFLLMMSFQSK